MKYISTRGKEGSRTFIQVVMEGLSRDGGLFIPESLPDFSSKLSELRSLTYTQLALEIMLPFIDGEISREVLEAIINESYRTFSTEEVTPLSKIGEIYLLELFHGPTLAFKDVALQFLGNLFQEILKRDNSTLNIIGATSGDTGSAAIYGVRGKKHINIFMLHPKGKISQIQERQMTTILDRNVFNIAVKGTFDDAQKIVKDIFNDHLFRDQFNLGAVNSINWARVMAQIVYYFYAAFRFQESAGSEPVVFSVPTGNFGDIYAGYLAKRMGLPIERLILATNENDILFRTLNTGVYRLGEICQTHSPSMDIQIASNFERYLFDLLDQNGESVQAKMEELEERGEFCLTQQELINANKTFAAIKVDNQETIDTINRYNDVGILLDPHTAVAVAAAENSAYRNVISLATAHPAKFGDAILKATGKLPPMPDSLAKILDIESRCIDSKNDYLEIESIIKKRLEGRAK